MTKTIITRRKLLSTVATASMVAAGAASGAASFMGQASAMTSQSAQEYWTKARTSQYLCSQIHYSKSLELARIIDSPNLDEAEKNLAIRTAKCPSCGIQIHPGGEAAGYSIGI